MKITSLAYLLVLAFVGSLSAEPTSWPPALKGAVQGTVTVTNSQFLEIPASVRETAKDPAAAPFVMAQTPPTVDLAFHGNLGDNAAARRLWSSWGDIGLARDGRVYCAIGDHGDDKGGDARCFIYSWNPQTKRLEQIVDMGQVVPPRAGQPAWSKVHAKLDEAADGKIYFSCTLNDGNRAKLDTYGFNELLPGGQIYQYDPATGKTTVYANLPPRRCTATSLLDRERNIWWCNLEAGEGNALWGFNLTTKQPVHRTTDGAVEFNRTFTLLRDGSILFNAAEGLAKYDVNTKQIVPSKSKPAEWTTMRSSTAESKSGLVFGVTHKTNQLFRYDVKNDQLTLLGPCWLKGSYTTVMQLSPDERFLYYQPGAHGGAFKDGTPIVQYELASGRQKVLAFLAPVFERDYDYVPAGTYGMKLSADGSTIYTNLNGHAIDGQRPKHLKAIGFGLTSFAAIHIPAAER